MQLVADDLHVGPQRAELPPRLAQHRLAEAVVLADQVDALERLVVLQHLHQRGHAHVGMRVEAEVPEAAALVGERSGRPPSSSGTARAATGRARCSCRWRRSAPPPSPTSCPAARCARRRRSPRAAPTAPPRSGPCCRSDRAAAGRAPPRQLDAAARVDALHRPQQVAEHGLAGVGEGAAHALDQGQPDRRRAAAPGPRATARGAPSASAAEFQGPAARK